MEHSHIFWGDVDEELFKSLKEFWNFFFFFIEFNNRGESLIELENQLQTSSEFNIKMQDKLNHYQEYTLKLRNVSIHFCYYPQLVPGNVITSFSPAHSQQRFGGIFESSVIDFF